VRRSECARPRLLFDDQIDVDATHRFLADCANVLLIAYVDGVPGGFVTGTELAHPDESAPELFLNELGVETAYRGRGIGRALVDDGRLQHQRQGSDPLSSLLVEGGQQ
jgi:ribosomal protein S18 acetylase RimI-like enzyme